MTLEACPPICSSAWIATDGEVRIEVAPSGDANDNAVLKRFVDAVRDVAPRRDGRADLRDRGGRDHRQGVLAGGALVAPVDRADPVRRACAAGPMSR